MRLTKVAPPRAKRRVFMNWDEFYSNLLNWIATEGVKILIAFIILIVSFLIIGALIKGLKKLFESKNVDKTIAKTICYICNIGLKILVVLALLGYLGIDTSGVAALITTAGVGVGLALQGSLSNVAGGVLIILLRPFRVDDYIEAQGVSGTVEDIHLIYTYVRTPDNKLVSIPNGTLANDTIVNYSKKDTRRVDLEFGIAYANDHKKAEEIILNLISAHEKCLKDPAPMCRIVRHDASAITLATKVWVNSADYWDVYFDLLEQVKTEFDAQGIEIPFNQLDVHVKNDEK